MGYVKNVNTKEVSRISAQYMYDTAKESPPLCSTARCVGQEVCGPAKIASSGVSYPLDAGGHRPALLVAAEGSGQGTRTGFLGRTDYLLAKPTGFPFLCTHFPHPLHTTTTMKT